MKTRQTIFNSIGLGLAAIAGLALLGNIIGLISERGRTHFDAQVHPWRTLYGMLMEAVVVCCAGGGGLANLVNGRLKRTPTLVMSIVYLLTCLFIPLGLWGFWELKSERDRRQRG